MTYVRPSRPVGAILRECREHRRESPEQPLCNRPGPTPPPFLDDGRAKYDAFDIVVTVVVIALATIPFFAALIGAAMR